LHFQLENSAYCITSIAKVTIANAIHLIPLDVMRVIVRMRTNCYFLTSDQNSDTTVLFVETDFRRGAFKIS